MEVDPHDHDPDIPHDYVEDAYRAQLQGDVEDGAQQEGDVDDGEDRVGNIQHPAGWWQRNWGWVVVAVGAGIAVVGGITVVYYLYRRIKRLERALGDASKYPRHQGMVENSFMKNAVSQCQKSIESLKQEVKGVSGITNELAKSVQRNSGDLSQCQKSIESLKQEVVQKIERNSGRINKLAKDQVFHDKKVLATEEKLVKTQRFVVDMAQRQKWPWPFNNRVHGLEEELGLPKK